jgi:putative hydrolase of the HAD superfamily
VKVLVFDMGGVLAVDAVRRKVHDLAERHGLPEAQLQDVSSSLRPLVDLGTMTESEFWTRSLQRCGVNVTPPDLQLDAYAAAAPGAVEFLRFARSKGLRLALLTNDSTELSKLRQEALGTAACFEAIFVSAAVGIAKPDVRLYRGLLSALREPAESCLFIDDREENVKAAHAVGMQAVQFIGFPELHRTIAELQENTEKPWDSRAR